MKHFIFIISIFLMTSSLASVEVILIEEKSEFHLCRFKSENHIVEHYFKMLPEKGGLNCEYAILVDDKFFKKYKAGSLDCNNFIRTQINKGSVCINNLF